MTDAKTHDQSYQGSFFALEIDALTLAWFTGCSGLSLEFDVTTFKEVVDAEKPTPYKTASIVLYDRLQTEIARFSLKACWPSKMSVSDLSSGSDDVMVEELTIQHEFLDWVKP